MKQHYYYKIFLFKELTECLKFLSALVFREQACDASFRYSEFFEEAMVSVESERLDCCTCSFTRFNHFRCKSPSFQWKAKPKNTNWTGRKAQYNWPPREGSLFCKNVNTTFNVNSSWSKLVNTRRSIVLCLPLQWGFLGKALEEEKLHLRLQISTHRFKSTFWCFKF